MLNFTNRSMNKIDSSYTEMIHAGLGQLVAEEIDAQNHTVTINGKKLINFALNSALGLETDKRVTSAISAAVQRFGASFIASRLFVSPPPFTEFELLMEQIFESYPVITSSTTLGHLSALPVLLQKNDVVIFDQHVHNSIRVAVKTVGVKISCVTVQHDNDLVNLEKFILRYREKQAVNNIWYLADGIYSMLGGECPVNDLLRLLNKYDNFYAYVDDAHGMSIAGKHGRGYVLDHCKKQHEKLIVAVSLSKSFGMGCGGAIICPNGEVQRKIKTCGNTWIYSSPIPLPMLSGGIALAKIHLSEEIVELQKKLAANSLYFQSLALETQLPLVTTTQPTHMNYIRIGDPEKAMDLTQKVVHDGFYVTYCPYPVVAKSNCGIRVVITAKHSKLEIEQLVESLVKHCEPLRLLAA